MPSLHQLKQTKNKVKAVVDAIKGFFSGMKLSLPHIKLPHFRVSGNYQLCHHSVPQNYLSTGTRKVVS